MANYTITTDTNLDAVNGGSWVNNDTVTVNAGCRLTINSNQTKILQLITVNQGEVYIVNASTSTAIRINFGRISSTADTGVTLLNSLCKFTVRGDWIEIGTGIGAAQDLTSPYPIVSSAGYDYVQAVWVETASGSGVYEAWHNITQRYGAGYHINRDDVDCIRADPKKGKFFRQLARNESTITTTHSQCTHFQNTLKFGETGTSNVIPSGCKVRVQNILVAEATAYGNAQDGLTLRSVLNAVAGIIDLDKCYIAAKTNLTSPTSIKFTNSTFYQPPNTGTVFDFTMTDCAVGSGAGIRWYDATLGYWRTRDDTRKTFTIGPLPAGGTLTRLNSIAVITFSNCINLTVDDMKVQWIYKYSGSGIGLCYITNVTDSTFNNMKLYGTGYLQLGNQTNVRITNTEVSLGLFNEINIPTTNVRADSLNCPRFYTLPDGTSLAYNTPYYFKLRSYRHNFDMTEYIDCPITYSATPYAGRTDLTDFSDMHPYFFGAVLWVNAYVWNVFLNWKRIDNLGMSFNKIRIFRSTAWGTLGSQQGADITVNTTVTYSDTTVANNTTYYYTLRYFRDATNYTDSAQQVVIVPNFTPAAKGTPWVVADNLLLQSSNLTLTWVKSGTFVPTTSYQNTKPGRTNDVSTSSSSYLASRIVWAAGGDGYVEQAVTVTNGSTYIFSVDLWSDQLSGESVTITLGANSTTCNLTQRITRFYVSATAGSTTLTPRITSTTSTRNKNTYMCYAQLELGTALTAPLNTTTAQVLNTLGHSTLFVNGGNTSLAAHSKGGLPCIELGIDPAAPNGIGWCEIFVGTNPSFTPSKENLIGSTQTYINGPFYFNGVINNLIIDGFTSYGYGCNTADNSTGGYAAPVYITVSNLSDVIIKNVTFNANGGAAYIVANQTTGLFNNLTLHNWTINGWRGYTGYLLNTGLVANTDLYLQNIVMDRQDNAQGASTTNSGLFIKSVGCTWSTTGIAPLATIRPISEADGLKIAGVQFDYIFGEGQHNSTTKGSQWLTFSASSKTPKPYTVTGSNILFDNIGRLYFGTADESIVYQWPWRIKGITGWRNIEPCIEGSALGDGTYSCYGLLREYSLSTDAVNWSAYKEMNGTNLSGESMSATLGFYMRVRLTPKLHLRYSGKVTSFVPGETIRNAAGTATAVVDRVFETGTVGTVWVSSVTGTWLYNESIRAPGGSTVRAVGNGDTVTGLFYPRKEYSYIDALYWWTTIDRTAKYPTRTPLITYTSSIAGSNMSAWDCSNNCAWLESNPSTVGTTGLLLVPWDGTDFASKLKLRRPGYKHFELTPTMTKYAQTYAAILTPWTRISASDPGSPSITITDHGASPVTWNSKQWRFTIQVNDSSTAAQVAQWFYWNTTRDASFAGYRGTAMSDLVIEDSGSGYETKIGSIDGNAVAAGGCRVLNSSGDGLMGFSRMQANDGSYYLPAVSYTLTVSDGPALVGAEIRIYDLDNIPAGSYGTELAGIESNPGTTFTYSYIGSGNVVLLQVLSAGYIEQEVTLTLPATDSTYTVNLRPDINA